MKGTVAITFPSLKTYVDNTACLCTHSSKAFFGWTLELPKNFSFFFGSCISSSNNTCQADGWQLTNSLLVEPQVYKLYDGILSSAKTGASVSINLNINGDEGCKLRICAWFFTVYTKRHIVFGVWYKRVQYDLILYLYSERYRSDIAFLCQWSGTVWYSKSIPYRTLSLFKMKNKIALYHSTF